MMRDAVAHLVAQVNASDMPDDEKMDAYDNLFQTSIKPVLEAYAKLAGMSRDEVDREFNILDAIFETRL